MVSVFHTPLEAWLAWQTDRVYVTSMDQDETDEQEFAFFLRDLLSEADGYFIGAYIDLTDDDPPGAVVTLSNGQRFRIRITSVPATE